MRIAVVFSVTLALAAGLKAPSRAQQGQSCLHYEPRPVEVRGRLALALKYGPPNYGETPETDQKLRVPILRLSKTLDVCGDSSSQLNRDSFRGVRLIQLVFSDTAAARRFAGREVVVTGTLSEAVSGHHFTDVLLTVSSIRAAT